MEYELFQSYEIKEVNGQVHIIVHVKPDLEEYSNELGLTTPVSKKVDIKGKAIRYVKRLHPFIKIGTITIMVGAIVLSVIPFEQVSAHEANFNMTYLYFGNTQSYITQIDRSKGNLNLVSPSYFDLNADGTLAITKQFDPYFVSEMHKRGIKVVPFLSNHWDRNVGRAALQNRELLSKQVANFILNNNLDGVQVDIENVTEIDRDNLTDLVRLIRAKLPENKEVSVAVAANPNNWTKGWHGSYDYKELVKYSSYLMVMAYDESYSGGPEGPVASLPWVERSIQYTLNQGIPPEKIVLGVPFYGRYWKEGATTGGDGIANNKVEELLLRYGSTVVFDEKSQSPKATITIKQGDPTVTIAGKTLGPGTYHIWFENGQSYKAKIDLVHKYNLKGTGSWSLGQENPAIWDEYKSWMTTHDGIPQGTTNGTQTTQPETQAPAYGAQTTYTVTSGDTLWKIATKFGLTVAQLKQYNHLSEDMIRVGQVLRIIPETSSSTTIVTTPVTTPVTAPVSTPTTSKTTSTTTAKVTPVSQVGKIMLPKANNTYMRSGAASSYKVVKTLTTKNEVKINQEFTDKKGIKWYRVQLGTTNGWVIASQLSLKPAPAPKPVTPATVKYGSKGSAVTTLQQKLAKAKFYKGKIDGSFGSGTKTALINFQKKYKLKADGIAGPTTWAKINSVIK